MSFRTSLSNCLRRTASNQQPVFVSSFSTSSRVMSSSSGPMESSIRDKVQGCCTLYRLDTRNFANPTRVHANSCLVLYQLTTQFQPSFLKIHNDSAAHSHHSAMRAADPSVVKTGETHFRVELVSAQFEGMVSLCSKRPLPLPGRGVAERGLPGL